eukprot:6212580-Pleurochrysis_carterae.AAC.2
MIEAVLKGGGAPLQRSRNVTIWKDAGIWADFAVGPLGPRRGTAGRSSSSAVAHTRCGVACAPQ